MKSVLEITMGDAAGIGPEVIVKALADKAIKVCGGRQRRMAVVCFRQIIIIS